MAARPTDSHRHISDEIDSLIDRMCESVDGQRRSVTELAAIGTYFMIAEGALGWQGTIAGRLRLYLAMRRSAESMVQILKDVDAIPSSDVERILTEESQRVC